jgi:TonB-dependent starch-binding outer membrane protein SusC
MYTCPTFAAKSQNRICMQKTSCFKKVLWHFFFLFLFFPFASISQENQNAVSGQVLDEKSAPMPGVTVTIENGQFRRSASTDAGGRFRFDNLDASLAYRLSFSHVGYGQKVLNDIRAGSASPLSISMELGVGAVGEEVVVVGYGTQSRRDVTSSVKTVKAAAFNRGIINSPQQLLQGKVAGVNVVSVSGEPGVAQNITIRGPGSIRSTSTPLFVIDGIPLDNALTGRGDPLNFLNPQDIESIDVLKDAAGSAIYGARGANGVVIVTTKRGKSGAPQANFAAGLGVSTLARKLDLFTADEFRAEVPKIGLLDDKGGDTDWQKEITRTAITQNYNLSMSGGSDKFTYYASFGMQNQEGIIKANDLKRYTGRFNASQRFWDDRLTIDANVTVTNTKNFRPPFSTVIGDAISNNPTYPAYGTDGLPAIYLNMSNPLILFDLEKEMQTINRVVGTISASFKIINGLVYKFNFGVDNSTGTNDIQSRPSANPVRLGRLETIHNYNRSRLVENYLTYTKRKGDHNFSAMAGHSYQKFFLQSRWTSINNFPVSPVEPQYDPGTGTLLDLANNRPGGTAIENELQSFFGRLTYGYQGKYLATVNFRADGSTKFGENNRYGYFPSLSLGWNVSDEDFMRNSPFYNLKLRASWGKTGNQEIVSKQTKALFVSSTAGGQSYPLYPSGAYPSGIVYRRLANPDLQWESSEQIDMGIDFALFKGALSGSIDMFRKVSRDILLSLPPTDPIQPASQYYKNVPDMTITNQGIELDLEYRHISKNGLNYNVGGNITFLNNKVQNSPYTVITSGSATGAGLTGATINGYINGEPIGTFYLKEYLGIGTDSLSQYTDLDKDGVDTDKDRIAAGSALPKVIYSFFAGLQYKGFDLNAQFNGVAGNKIYDLTANTSFLKVRLSKSINTTSDAIAEPGESTKNSSPVSTRYLKNGAYLRLNNLTLGYNFNTQKLGINKYFSTMRLSVTGQNLFVITKYDGFDPEVNADRNIDQVVAYGIDYLSYPKARTILFSLNLQF